MPRSHSDKASRDDLARWEANAYPALRAQRDATTPTDDELPEDPLDHREELRSAIQRLDRA